MLKNFDSQVANDLNKLMQTYQEDPSGKRLQNAIQALNHAAEDVLKHWSTLSNPLERSQTMIVHDGLKSASSVVSNVLHHPELNPLQG